VNIEFRAQVSLPFHCAKIHPCSGIRKTGVIGWFPYWTLGFLHVPLNVLADINTKATEEFCPCVCATTLLSLSVFGYRHAGIGGHAYPCFAIQYD